MKLQNFYNTNTIGIFSILTFVLTITFLSVFSANAADGDLDASFGTNGIANEGAPFSGFETVVVQPDGKILTAGRVLVTTPTFVISTGVIRYNSNGTLDNSFGTNGKLIVEVAGGTLDFPTLVLQPDGKFLIVGRFSPTGGNNPKVGLARFNPNGTLDTTFGMNGLTVSNFPEGNTNSQSDAVLQPDGKIVVAGSWRGTAFCVARWNANGSLDTNFGTTNGDTCVNTNGTGSTQSIALQTDGKIVMSGRRTSSFTVPFDFIVFRFNPNGTPDASFDGDGYATTDLNGNDNALSVIVRPNGKILAIGSARAFNGPDTGFGLVQYNTDGSLDQTFGTGGKSIVTFAGGETFLEDFPAALMSNGKVVVGRSRRRASPNIGNESQIARFNENGSLDTTFGSGGQFVFLPIQNVLDLTLQPDGKIVAVGTNQPGNSIIARFFNTDSAPPVNNPTLRYADFDGDGKADVSLYRAGTWFINPSGAPSFTDAPNAAYGVQFGQASDITVPADYDGDGKTDIAVWRGAAFANFYILNSSNNTFRAEQFGQTGDNPTISGDWDADGKADLAVYRSGAQSRFYYRPSAQTGVDFIPVQWGTTGDAPVFGDFDGDKKLDAAVYRPSNNTFYVRQSANGAALVRQWGNAATDAVFAGDFDGDGKSDFAVQRFSGANAGTWYVLSSGSNPTMQAFQWGSGSDVPVPADYDGDNKMDFAVFRRSNGTWYIYQSASGTARYSVFGAGNDFPLPLNLVR